MFIIKFNISLLFFLIGSITLYSQVLVVPTNPNAELFFFDNLFQVNLINSNNKGVIGYLEIDVQERRQKSVVKIASPKFPIEAGQMISSTEINWRNNIDFGRSQLAASLAETGSLPFGEYIFCYRFISAETGLALGVSCQEKAIKVHGKPALLSPRNRSTINIPNPALTWKPPLPLVSSEIRYSLKLTYLEDGQSPVEAINRNFSILSQRGLRETVLLYPQDAIPLEIGKKYVWQVTAFYEGYELGQTEMWMFTYGLESNDKETISLDESYRFVKPTLNASYYTAVETLKFAYENKYDADNLKYKIYSADKVYKSLNKLPKVKLNKGVNYIDLEASALGGLTDNEKYILEIKNKIGQIYYFNFIYKSQKK